MNSAILRDQIAHLFHLPLQQLLLEAQTIHLEHHKNLPLERCSVLSVKTGNCGEDCAYCPQSSRYPTHVQPHALLDKKIVMEAAQKARENKSSYFCLATAGREVKSEKEFALLLEMVQEIAQLDLKVCTSLGFLDREKAKKLKEAGVFSYNHNIDTSPNYYKKIISTHCFEDRLKTIELIKNASMKVCVGGILGMGETIEDHMEFIYFLATIAPHSIPLNTLVMTPNTLLEKSIPIAFFDFLRILCTLRILLPKSILRLAGGRGRFSHPEQVLLFTCGIGGVHVGEKLLVLPHCSTKEDERLFALLEKGI